MHEVETAAIRKYAWHDAGVRVPDHMTIEEGFELAGLGEWNLKTFPSVTFIRRKDVVNASSQHPTINILDQVSSWETLCQQAIRAGGWISQDVAYIPIDRQGHFRTKDWTLLGDVGKTYQSIHNEYLGDVFRLLCDENGIGVAKLESLGSLRSGKLVWALLSLPDSGFTIGNRKDQIIPYLLGSNSHDGSAAASFLPTTVRVVCQNTHNAAMGEAYASLAVKVRHTGDIEAKMKDVQAMMAQAAKMFGDYKVIGDKLDDVKVSDDAFGEMMDFLFPPLTGVDEANKQKVANRNAKVLLLTQAVKEEVMLLPQYTATNERKEFSYWTLLNGITRFTTHSQGVRVGKDENEGEKRFESQLLGAGAEFTAKATKKILDLSGVK